MDSFLKYFYQDIGRVFRAFTEIFSAFFNFLNYLLNFPMRMQIIKSYSDDFGTMDWIMLLLANLLILGLSVLLVIFLVRLVRKLFRFRVSPKEYDAMAKQVRSLQRFFRPPHAGQLHRYWPSTRRAKDLRSPRPAGLARKNS